MSRVVVNNSATLDGVMQAPGRPDEDLRGDFRTRGLGAALLRFGHWQRSGRRNRQRRDLLLGRRTYEDFASFWPNQSEDNPFTAVMNNFQKYVASRTLEEPLSWNNSKLLKGDAAEAVARLKQQPGSEKDLVILGSGELIESLMAHNLIDQYMLLIHPLVLGTGRRLFTDGGAFSYLRLVDTKTTTTGVVIATYQPVQTDGREDHLGPDRLLGTHLQHEQLERDRAAFRSRTQVCPHQTAGQTAAASSQSNSAGRCNATRG